MQTKLYIISIPLYHQKNVKSISILKAFAEFFYLNIIWNIPVGINSETEKTLRICQIYHLLILLIVASHASFNIIFPCKCISSCRTCVDYADSDSEFPTSQYFVVCISTHQSRSICHLKRPESIWHDLEITMGYTIA